MNTLLIPRLIPICVLVSGLVSIELTAQEKPEPPARQPALPADTTGQAGQLPKIDLPEFVITGNEAIELTDFNKTAIEDHAYSDVSSHRGPGERETPGVTLGGSTKARTVPAVPTGGFGGKLTGGYGSFRTPFAEGWIGKSSGEYDILLKGGFKSSDGHVSHADFTRGHFELSGGFSVVDDARLLAGNRLQGAIGYQGNSYRLYGHDNPTRKRTVNRIMVDAATSGDAGDLFTYTSGISIRSGSIKDSIRTAQTYVGLDFSADRSVDDLILKGTVAFWGSSYSAPSATGSPYHFQFGVSARYRMAPQLDVLGGATVYALRSSDAENKGVIYPMIGVSWYAVPWMTLFARFEPYVERNSLSSIAGQVPYVVNDVVIHHPRHFNKTSVGAEFDWNRSVTSRVSVGYEQVLRYPIAVESAAGGLWNVEYFGRTRILSFEGELFARITDRDDLGASVTVRSSRNSVTQAAIPYLPSVSLSTLYQHRFPFDLTVGASLQLIGERYTDLSAMSTLDPVTVLDLKGEFMIIRPLSVALMFNNILDRKQTLWDGYSGIGRNIAVSLSYTW